METINIKRKLVEEALDQLKAAQQDSFVESTQNVIDELELALRQQPVMRSCEGNCGMNYCNDNGCIERKRILVEPKDLSEHVA